MRLLHSDLAGPVNIGNPHESTILDLAQLVITLCGAEVPIDFLPPAPDDPAVRCPDIGLATATLGWEPAVDVRDGLLTTIGWFADTLHIPRPARIPSPARPGSVSIPSMRQVGASAPGPQGMQRS